jgi:uncharacterized protein (DUF58 family)
MTIGPDGRLVQLVAVWTVAAAALVVWPAPWPLFAAALATLALVAALDGRWLARTPALVVTRRVPERAFLGRADAITLVLHNPGADAAHVDVIDELPRALAADEPGASGLVVAGGGDVTLSHAIQPTARGDVRLGPVIVLQHAPLGLWRRRSTADAGAVLRVYPDASRYLRREALEPRRVLQVLGVRPARERGEGMEFESLRDYVEGDDVRRIDWAATARRGRPVTRLFRHERNRTVLVALDASRLMGSLVDGRTKLDHAIDAALALAYGAITAGDRIGMLVFDGAVRALLEPGPRRHLGAFVDLLRTVEPRLVEADYMTLAQALGGGRRQRALVIVLTDFVDADPAAVLHPLALLARRHRVLFVAVRDRAYGGLVPRAADGPLDLYRRLVLDELLADRERTLARLRRAGLATLDLAPEHITTAVLNRYLTMRQTDAA